MSAPNFPVWPLEILNPGVSEIVSNYGVSMAVLDNPSFAVLAVQQ